MASGHSEEISTTTLNDSNGNNFRQSDEVNEMIVRIESIIERYESNTLDVNVVEFTRMYDMIKDINIGDVYHLDSYNRVISVLKFLTDQDIDKKYLPTAVDDWENYLDVLNLDDILSTPLKDTLSDNPIKPDSEITNDKTVVTLYYNITEITGKSYSRYGQGNQHDKFKQLSEHLLKCDQCMYIFCDPKLIDHVKHIREENGFWNKTIIYPFNIKESPYYLLKPLIKQCFIQSRYASGVSPGGEKLFHNILLPLVWTKMKTMEMAAKENHFSSKSFIWIDFGIFKLNDGANTSESVNQLIDHISDNDKIVMSYIYNTSPLEIEDRRRFYCNNRWKMIGGMFSVPLLRMNRFITTWTEELKHNLECGYPALEEQVLACVKARIPESFNCYQADYHDLFVNIMELQTGFHIIINNLRHCNNLSYYEGVSEIASTLFERIPLQTGRYTINEILQIYNEILTGCRRFEKDRPMCIKIVDRIKHLLPQSSLPEGDRGNLNINIGIITGSSI